MTNVGVKAETRLSVCRQGLLDDLLGSRLVRSRGPEIAREPGPQAQPIEAPLEVLKPLAHQR